tara:strand:+ start:968 stop:1855 length:888 start_codon:yes stop_codon:yes gene_type:complete
MILLKKCPLCSGLKFAKKLTCTDHTKSKENFTIVSCETCKFTFTNPRPKEESLGEYYKSEMYISHTNSSKGIFNWMYQTVRKHSIRAKVLFLKKIKSGGAHLDIGCGTGEFLNACRKSGFITKGVEPSLSARKQAIENYNISVSEESDLSQYNASEFDSVTMWHVLEHITDLNETAGHLHRILKPDGKLIIAVPNHNCWEASYYKEFWAGWDVPIHLWHFSKSTMEKLFKKHKFKLLKTKPMIFDSYYVSLLSEEFSSGEKKFFKGFVVGFISNLFGVFTKRGHSSIIYVFEKEK